MAHKIITTPNCSQLHIFPQGYIRIKIRIRVNVNKSYLREFSFIRIVVQLYIYEKITIIAHKVVANNHKYCKCYQLLSIVLNCF